MFKYFKNIYYIFIKCLLHVILTYSFFYYYLDESFYSNSIANFYIRIRILENNHFNIMYFIQFYHHKSIFYICFLCSNYLTRLNYVVNDKICHHYKCFLNNHEYAYGKLLLWIK